jgi:two-component system chemotaxis response regulator CheY
MNSGNILFMFPPNTDILVVDDSVGYRKAVVSHLATLGYQNILEAEEGRQAYDTLVLMQQTGMPVGLVISDWNMPKMTGLELLQAVRGSPSFAKTPFLMVTSQNDMKLVIQAIKAGVNDYIVKPIDADLLKEKLVTIWSKVSASS